MVTAIERDSYVRRAIKEAIRIQREKDPLLEIDVPPTQDTLPTNTECLYTIQMFLAFHFYNDCIIPLREQLKNQEKRLDVGVNAIIKRYLKYEENFYNRLIFCASSVSLLRCFSLNIDMKSYYYLRKNIENMPLSNRLKIVDELKSATAFGKLRKIGYDLVLFEGENLDYYTFQVYHEHCKYEYPDNVGKNQDSKLNSVMFNILSMELCQSDFIDLVIASCDVHCVSKNRMKYTTNFIHAFD